MLFDAVMSTPSPLGTGTVPAAFVPMKFPSIRFVELPMLIPAVALPEMTLRAAAVVPPMVLFVRRGC